MISFRLLDCRSDGKDRKDKEPPGESYQVDSLDAVLLARCCLCAAVFLSSLV
jgi:hypothetical protein